jgi:hypothetical protein
MGARGAQFRRRCRTSSKKAVLSCEGVSCEGRSVATRRLGVAQLGGRASATMALVALTATLLAGIYPDGHFDHVTKVTDETMFNALVKEQVDAGKTLFVRWIASEG